MALAEAIQIQPHTQITTYCTTASQPAISPRRDGNHSAAGWLTRGGGIAVGLAYREENYTIYSINDHDDD